MKPTPPACPKCKIICREMVYYNKIDCGDYQCPHCGFTFSYDFESAALLQEIAQLKNRIAELEKETK